MTPPHRCNNDDWDDAHQVLRGWVQQVLDELAVDLHVGHGDGEGVERILRRTVEDVCHSAWDHADGGDVRVAQRIGLPSACGCTGQHISSGRTFERNVDSVGVP